MTKSKTYSVFTIAFSSLLWLSTVLIADSPFSLPIFSDLFWVFAIHAGVKSLLDLTFILIQWIFFLSVVVSLPWGLWVWAKTKDRSILIGIISVLITILVISVVVYSNLTRCGSNGILCVNPL